MDNQSRFSMTIEERDDKGTVIAKAAANQGDQESFDPKSSSLLMPAPARTLPTFNDYGPDRKYDYRVPVFSGNYGR